MVIWVPLPNRCRQCARGLQNGHLGKQTGSQTHPTEHPLFEYPSYPMLPMYNTQTRIPCQTHALNTALYFLSAVFILTEPIHPGSYFMIYKGRYDWVSYCDVPLCTNEAICPRPLYRMTTLDNAHMMVALLANHTTWLIQWTPLLAMYLIMVSQWQTFS